MTPDRAKTIVGAINDRAFVSMGIGDGALPSLEGVSLAEMIEAATVVRALNTAAEVRQRAEGGSVTISVVPDDRLIAAVYCMEHFPCDDESILCVPASRQERFLGGRTHKALAVVAVTPTADEDGAEEAA
jgi:hypothetical protein